MKPQLLFLAVVTTAAASAQSDSTKAADTLAAKSMAAVTVSTARRPVEVYPDKTVLNVEASFAAIGQNALEFLRQAPGVVVDAAENIGLANKPSVAVWIDGRPTQLSGQDLANLLKSIEASNVKQVELIANPSAKYDAAGTAGIINIKLKKSLTDGLAGNLSGSWVQSKHARRNGTANLTWRKGKTAAYLNAGANSGLQHTLATNDRISGPQSIMQRSIERDYFNGHSLRAGLDYSLTPNATLGVLYTKNYRYTRMENGSATVLRLPFQPDTIINTTSIAPMPADRNAYNLNYAYTKNGVALTADADHTLFETALNNNVSNRTKGTGSATATGIRNNVDVTIKMSSVRVDAEKTFAKGLKLESGAKFLASRTQSNLSVGTATDDVWATDSASTNNFRYNEDISAAYASLKGESGKWAWQAGLRAEHTNVQGRAVNAKGVTDNRPDTSYLNLFPTLYLQFTPVQNHQLNLTAHRRIDRPSYQDQTPFVYALDALNIEVGNPYLMPQFTNSVEIGYTYKWATSVKLGYAKTTDYKEGLTYQAGKNTVQIQQNAGTREMVSLSVSTPLQPAKWWSVYVSASPYYHHYNVALNGFAASETQSGGSFAFNGYAGNNFKLGKGWAADLSGWFNYQNRATIYVSKPLGSMNVGVQKNVLKNAATLKLSVVDVFNTQRWQQTASTANLYLTTYRKWESQNITVGFSWRFGNSKLKAARERKAVGEEDAGRIKEK